MKGTQEKAALLLRIIKGAHMYGNDKAVDSPSKWPDLLKLSWRQYVSCLIFWILSKWKQWESIAPTSLWILPASNYYLARGDDQRVIATTGPLMSAGMLGVYSRTTHNLQRFRFEHEELTELCVFSDSEERCVLCIDNCFHPSASSRHLCWVCAFLHRGRHPRPPL